MVHQSQKIETPSMSKECRVWCRSPFTLSVVLRNWTPALGISEALKDHVKCRTLPCNKVKCGRITEMRIGKNKIKTRKRTKTTLVLAKIEIAD